MIAKTKTFNHLDIMYAGVDIDTLAPGETVEYYQGSLAPDRYNNKDIKKQLVLNAVATKAMLMQDMGLADLTQAHVVQSISNKKRRRYSYRITKRKFTRRGNVNKISESLGRYRQFHMQEQLDAWYKEKDNLELMGESTIKIDGKIAGIEWYQEAYPEFEYYPF